MGSPRVLAIVVLALLLGACAADPMFVPSNDASIDAGPDETPSEAQTLSGTPAPLAPTPHRAPSGALACPLALPAGDCDRCPERPCRQVRLSAADDARWAMFCEQGDVREEARIACLCGGGEPRHCELAANDAAVALAMIESVFGGEVPPVGTRYRDANGLRAVVDEATHAWLSQIASPPRGVRCDAPDPVAATLRYQALAQRVRMHGNCDASP